MQLGAELEIRGDLDRAALETALAVAVERWPRIGRIVVRRLLGVAWVGPPRLDAMLAEADGIEALEPWRNVPIDPFVAPPFQLLWVRGEGAHTLAFRAHHAALDGEAFVRVCSDVVDALGPSGPTPAPPPAAPTRPSRPRRWRDWRGMWRYKTWLERNATDPDAPRLALVDSGPGPIDAASLRLDPGGLAALEARASDQGVALPWLVAACWLRALHRWNSERGLEQRLLSLEFPVSLRRKRVEVLGNRVSPLLLLGEGAAPAGELAASFGAQLKQAIRQQAHRAVPLFAAPGAWLPWWLFRRLAVRPRTSAFASSHFTWLAPGTDPGASLAERTGGALEVTGRSFWTPVCLEMGVALLALIFPGRLELGITWRRTSLPEGGAERIRMLLEDELGLVRNGSG